jgi:hypothetical protein
LAAAAFLLIGIKDRVSSLTVVGICMTVLFFFLVKKHEKLAVKQELKRTELNVVNRYVERFEDGWREFADDGNDFIQEEDTVPVDTDLLGKASLYQMICVAHTRGGKTLLAEALRRLDKVETSELKKRNEAAFELAEKKDFSISFETLGEELEGHHKRKKSIDIDEFTEFCNDDERGDMPAWARVARLVVPMAFFILLILGLAGVCSLGVAVIMFFAALVFSWLTKSVTDHVIAPFYGISFAASDYKRMMELIANTEFYCDKLKGIRTIYLGRDGVLSAFSKLGVICQAYNIVYNPLIHQLLSGMLLWDYQLAYATARWKKKYGKQISEAFSGIYELEFLLSLSVVPNIRDTVSASLPVSEADNEAIDGLHFFAKGLYHPLISAEKVVANDADLKDGITIITGSNMSGKTTFLRTVAINLALAYIGAPVCAKELSTGYMRIFTSMRVHDDVANGISTFYAEILRIKAMVEFKNKTGGKEPMLCMVDEIFKGTNSADRIVGAREAITGLAGKYTMVVVSTHDFELCNIEDREHKPAANYHFEEYYEEDRLMFDYRIRDGRCTTTNAVAILRMAGIVPLCGN